MQSLSQNRQLAPSSYDAQELTDTVMNILGLVAEDDTPDAPVARELAQVVVQFGLALNLHFHLNHLLRYWNFAEKRPTH